ncbi:hypothetical protein G5714_004545 [Onychostoma macrolepis]|uniref:Uncharacterized protein n=1 Tax=Onychostoma macrolepis TaxID=369639 RepID=A0A7J6D545_9TELE|nr:hypothetical protein G5714_004545 [Onychostoma macrolepis]
MERKLTRDDILDILFDSDAESGSSSDGPLSESNEEAHLPENLAGCDRSVAPAIPDNAGPASEGAVVEDFLPTWTSNPFSPPALDFDNTTKGVQAGYVVGTVLYRCPIEDPYDYFVRLIRMMIRRTGDTGTEHTPQEHGDWRERGNTEH